MSRNLTSMLFISMINKTYTSQSLFLHHFILSLNVRKFIFKKEKKKEILPRSLPLSFFIFFLPTDIGGYTSRTLQKVSLPVLSPDTCNFLFGRPLASGEFCAGYRQGGKDACQVSDWQHQIAALNRRRLPLLLGSN